MRPRDGRLGHQETGKRLEFCGFARAVSGCSLPRFPLEAVAERRRAETFAYFAHEGDGAAASAAHRLDRWTGVHKIFQPGAECALPKRDTRPIKNLRNDRAVSL